MADYGLVSVRWYPGEIHAVLRQRGGMVDRFSFREAQKVVNKAKVLTSGGPHGKDIGRPSAPGGPPGVRTGEGRRSIRARPDTTTPEASWSISSDVFYMSILELRAHAPYPWLVPSLDVLGYSVRGGMTGSWLA